MQSVVASSITPNQVFGYLIDKFKHSINELSFAGRTVFYHEYIICFNANDYQEFMENKKGIFGLIVQEAVKEFYNILTEARKAGKTVQPSASKWVFRFVSHPSYEPGDKGFIGKLLPGASQMANDNLRVTFIPRLTGIAQTFDINPDILNGFNFYSEGYYEVPYQEQLVYDGSTLTSSISAVKARFEAIVPEKGFAGKKIEYLMKDNMIYVSGNEDNRNDSNIFKVPTEWVNTQHLQIKWEEQDKKFYLASFGEQTLLNERSVHRSDTARPEWVELPVNSRIMLNGIVGINIFKQ